jgi:hypothetical protein
MAETISGACIPAWARVRRRLASPQVPGDELIGNVVQVAANNLRLRTDSQKIIAGPLNERCVPASSNRSKHVPAMAGDHTQIGGLSAKFLLDIGISSGGRLIVLDAVRAQALLEEIGNTTVFQLLRYSGTHAAPHGPIRTPGLRSRASPASCPSSRIR